MRGGKNKQPLGYTIIEVMIVLAVSGVIFVIAANFINGKQQRTAFNQGVNETASRIQATINQVADGQYSDIPFNCSASSTPLRITAASDSTNSQGTNSDCVFIGKFWQMAFDGNPAQYEVFSLATERSALELGPDVTPVRSSDGVIDLTVQQTIPQNLEITDNGIVILDDNRVEHKPNYGFGFTQSQGAGGAEAGTYASGAQTVNLVYTPSLSSPTNQTSAISAITGRVALARSATFCLTDGRYYAQIGIGDDTANGNRLGVKVTMRGEQEC